MRAAASGMSREDGFAAMEAEAKRLREGKPKPQGGCVKDQEGTFRAVFHWSDAGVERELDGPRRAEKRRALDDLEAMRSAQSGIDEAAAQKSARAAEASRLQQQVEI